MGKPLTEERARERLTFVCEWARAEELKALIGIDPSYGTPRKRRILIQMALRDGLKCAHCNTPLKFQWNIKKGESKKFMATFDHIIPASQGGPRHITNGVLSCKYCNQRRGNMEFNAFQTMLHQQSAKTDQQRKRKERRSTERKEEQTIHMIKIAFLLHLLKQYNTTKYYEIERLTSMLEPV